MLDDGDGMNRPLTGGEVMALDCPDCRHPFEDVTDEVASTTCSHPLCGHVHHSIDHYTNEEIMRANPDA